MTAARGFTLIEVIAALALGAMVLALAHGVVGATNDSLARLSVAEERLSRTHNGYRWLAESLRAVHVHGSEGAPFSGARTSLAYSTWLPVAGGWSEPDRLRIELAGTELTATMESGATVVLRDSVAGLEIDYLRERGERSPWVSTWTSDVTAPVGVRLRVFEVAPGGSVRVDTLLFGPRTRDE